MNQLDVLNPSTGEVIGQVAFSNWDQLDQYLQQAHETFADKSQRTPAHERTAILKRCAQLMKEQQDDFAMLIATEGGKPLKDAYVEVIRAIDGVELCANELHNLKGEQIPMDLTAAGAGRMAFTYREPIGPVVAVSAFNHPLNLIVHQVAPAIAVNCPILIKPANDTPLSAQKFVELLYQAGLDQKWCRFFVAENEDTERVVTDPRTAFFSFIGSSKVGWYLRSQLAPGTRCALEHGGAAPVIIDDTVDIDAILPAIVKGGFYHSGQVCVSVQRIYITNNTIDVFAKKLVEQVNLLVVGDAREADTECGPLIRPAECQRVADWVDEARNAGAQILTGGKKLSQTHYEPTVILNPNDDLKVSAMEIFGPVVCLYGVDNLKSAYKRANNVPYSFQASVFSNSLETVLHAQHELDASTVLINDHTAFRVDWMPFAGRKQSGYGVGGIPYTMRDLTEEKMVIMKLPTS
ncbi:aldehyde dehydrogenase family protein [Shewanella donghaensis]|uniref:aldehyde dehydrogenase family protein n=1 Tax=Shewanella donghaensis TaxID=238836 RepID=UPI001182A2C9|nr:aldehyde dehydrogenase family protein [Shewanella donghaensis]